MSLQVPDTSSGYGKAAWYSLACLVLLGWSQSAGHWPCALIALVMLCLIIVLAGGLLETSRMRRQAWLTQYFVEEGRVYRLLRGGVVMRIVAVGLATVSVTVLLAQAPLWTGWHWVALVGSAICVAAIQQSLEARLRHEVRAEHLAKVVRVISVRTNVVLLAVAIATVSIVTPQPAYQGLTMEAVLAQVEPEANCQLAGMAIATATIHQEGWYWILQNFVGGRAVGGSAAVGVWAALLLVLSTAYAWAFTRLLVGIDFWVRGHRHDTK